jgi:hypothetical protein
MKQQQFAGRPLSRKEQKNIMGGMYDCNHELCCYTPNGEECWKRSGIGSDATSACRAIYPAYGDAVSGVWFSVCAD